MMNLPEKTVERLSEYRRILLNCEKDGKTHIFSHELAELDHITAVQVRRDIMLMGFTSVQRKGYNVKELIKAIGNLLDSEEGLNVGVVGIGNLGRALTAYFKGKRSKLNIVASFDVSPEKVNRVISGVKCYHMNDMADVIREKNIHIGVITAPPEFAVEIAEKLSMAGINGILNFTSVPLNVSPNVYLEEYDMITSIEKVAYFVKKQSEDNISFG